MDFYSMSLIAIGLAMDATAVSMAYGAVIKKDRLPQALRFCFSFGMFQLFMPIIGWYAGTSISGFISGYGHWIAFGLLLFIGGKMFYEASLMKKDKECCSVPFHTLLGLSIATSIDSLAVGVSFAFLDVGIIAPVVMIGAVTFLMSLAGFFAGSRLGELLEDKMEKAAGLILILIGFKILLERIL
jgi:manganese efflux pump family protein